MRWSTGATVVADEPDPRGVAEAPNTAPMQRAADALRGLLVGEHSPAYREATIRMAVDMMELQTDWLMDQHRLIRAQSETVETLNSSLAELNSLVRQLLGRRDPG